MILNNYQAMSMLRPMAGRPLTPHDGFELHQALTEDTLDDSTAAGRLQRLDEERVVVQAPDGTVAHVPPPAAELPDRLDAIAASRMAWAWKGSFIRHSRHPSGPMAGL